VEGAFGPTIFADGLGWVGPMGFDAGKMLLARVVIAGRLPLLCAGLVVLGNDTKFHLFWPAQPFVSSWHLGLWRKRVPCRSWLSVGQSTPMTFSVCLALGSQGMMDWTSIVVKGLVSSFSFDG
jgi:hypothetical protein